MLYQKQNMWFSITKYLQLFPYYKIMCLRMNFFPQNSHIRAIPSHVIMIQNQQEFKIPTYNVPFSIPFINALFIQNNVINLPP
jgi:hypothetical protein